MIVRNHVQRKDFCFSPVIPEWGPLRRLVGKVSRGDEKIGMTPFSFYPNSRSVPYLLPNQIEFSCPTHYLNSAIDILVVQT